MLFSAQTAAALRRHPTAPHGRRVHDAPRTRELRPHARTRPQTLVFAKGKKDFRRTTLFLFIHLSLSPLPPLLQSDLSAGLEEELAGLSPTLQRYAELTSRPAVSFAQDSPDSPLPVQSFLSQMECQGGEVKVVRGQDTDWNQLGKGARYTHTHTYGCVAPC